MIVSDTATLPKRINLFSFLVLPHFFVGFWGRVFCARGKTWFRSPTLKKSEELNADLGRVLVLLGPKCFKPSSEDDGVLAQESTPGCQAQAGGCAGGQGAPPQTGKGGNVIWGELGASRRVRRPSRHL